MRLTAATLLAALAPSSAAAWPTPPAWWRAQAACIRSHEGSWTTATGNGYEGAYQFKRSTWVAVGGSVDWRGHWASVATPAEQTYRAWLNWRANGNRWGGRQWPVAARLCGLA